MIIGCAHDVSQMCAHQMYEKVGSIRGILSRMSGVSSLGWSFLILLYGHWKSCSFSVREVSWQWEWLHFWKVIGGLRTNYRCREAVGNASHARIAITS